MRKKIIVIATIIVCILLTIIILVIKNEKEIKGLTCEKEDKSGAKVANLIYNYSFYDDGIVLTSVKINMEFINSEEADNYEKIAGVMFLNGQVTRNNNKIEIQYEDEESNNGYTKEEIKKQMQNNGFICE